MESQVEFEVDIFSYVTLFATLFVILKNKLLIL